jgi:hypothetical protein
VDSGGTRETVSFLTRNSWLINFRKVRKTSQRREDTDITTFIPEVHLLVSTPDPENLWRFDTSY